MRISYWSSDVCSSYLYDNGPASPATPETRFVSKVLADTEDAWGAIFQQKGWGHYQQAKLVLFNGATPTACGTGQSAMGPFYCPGDSKVYLDLSFFKQMAQQLNSPGDFADRKSTRLNSSH